MRVRCSIVVVLFAAAVFAQSAPCPADRPVDDIIAEIHKQQSKKNNRNTNPIPTSICIFGWCRGGAGTPPTVPGPAPEVDSASTPKPNPRQSSSSTYSEQCNAATDRALDAAHNVEVGDFYFQDKNYKAAQLRYQDALDSKPNDAAIEVRLGRAFEKLNDPQHAIEHYQAAEKLAGPDKWAQEAHAALARLQH